MATDTGEDRAREKVAIASNKVTTAWQALKDAKEGLAEVATNAERAGLSKQEIKRIVNRRYREAAQ